MTISPTQMYASAKTLLSTSLPAVLIGRNFGYSCSSVRFYKTQLPAFLRRSGLSEALKLVQEERIRNLELEDPGVFSGLVFVGDRPYRVRLESGDEEFEWTCECGQDRPCVHAAALLLACAQMPELQGSWVAAGLRGHLESGSQDRDLPVPAEILPKQLNLFEEEGPQSATGTASPPLGKKLRLVFSLEPGLPVPRMKPYLMGQGLADEDFYPFEDELSIQPMPEAMEELLYALRTRQEMAELPAALELIQQEEALSETRLRWPLYWQKNPIPLRLARVSRLEIEFTLTQTGRQGGKVYHPEFSWFFESGSRPLHTREQLAVWNAEGFFAWYQEDRNWLCYQDDWFREIRFFRQMAALAFHEIVEELPLPGAQRPWSFNLEEVKRLSRILQEQEITRVQIRLPERQRPVLSPRPQGVAYIQGNAKGTEVLIGFNYGDWKPKYQDRELEREILDPEGQSYLLRRNLDQESRILHAIVEVLGSSLVYERGYYATELKGTQEPDIQSSVSLHDFLLQHARELIRQGIQVLVEKRRLRIGKELKISVKPQVDWFGIKVEASLEDGEEGIPSLGNAQKWSHLDLANRMPALSQNPPDLELESGLASSDGGDEAGASGIAPEESLGFDASFEKLGLVRRGQDYVILREKDLRRLEYLRRQGMSDRGELQASAANLQLIDLVYENLQEEEIKEDWNKRRLLLDSLRRPESLPPVQPARDLRASLRPYQRLGLNWLVAMYEEGLNPCLADDMGLGKTLQTIALLGFLKERGVAGPHLLITPVVTLGNWEEEIRRFAPSLRVYPYRGSRRELDPAVIEQRDIVLVSYHTLRNDIELFLDLSFNYLILDEAHYIKNHYSQVFKAVRSLRSRHRLSLTGTPIENTLMELWSQMNFLNPGLLGSAKEFYDRFYLPIEKQGKQDILRELKEIVGPLILRRTKEEVLNELPAKEVIVQYCEMDGAQAEAYAQQRDYYRDLLLGILDLDPATEDGESREAQNGSQNGRKGESARPATQFHEIEAEPDLDEDEAPAAARRRSPGIEVFRFLLKLRQLAVHPPLAGEPFHMVPSAKMDALLMLLEDILKEEHKVLVFSQFVGTLELIAKRCEERAWGYSLLTGATRERSSQIRSFQEEEEKRIFLLSLKAGGVGINLTAADYVILFDPWWNPAAEQQAIDRAHRMGQKNKVIAYKLIVRGTIEEKILQLQERKQALAEEIITESGGFLKSLKKEEVVELFS